MGLIFVAVYRRERLSVVPMVILNVHLTMSIIDDVTLYGELYCMSMMSCVSNAMWINLLPSNRRDALLMEAGFLAFIFAPIPLLMPSQMHAKLSHLSMWPVKWLFFRLMLMSGILKLQSGCQTWWKLTGKVLYSGFRYFSCSFFYVGESFLSQPYIITTSHSVFRPFWLGTSINYRRGSTL